MASNSSVTVKHSERTSKTPSRLYDEIGKKESEDCESHSKFKKLKKRKTEPKNKFYEVEIKELKTEESKVLIHFKGYGDEYDGWRPYTPETFPIVRFQPLMLPSPETLNERFSLLSQRLRLEIKKRLRTWRRDDPDVRIEMEIDRDCFDLLKSCGKVVDK